MIRNAFERGIAAGKYLAEEADAEERNLANEARKIRRRQMPPCTKCSKPTSAKGEICRRCSAATNAAARAAAKAAAEAEYNARPDVIAQKQEMARRKAIGPTLLKKDLRERGWSAKQIAALGPPDYIREYTWGRRRVIEHHYAISRTNA